MPVQYKIDVLSALKDKGYSTYQLRKQKILGEATIQKIREGKSINWENLGILCELLQCQPGDLLVYKPDHD